jgi:hypothetical protein
MGPPPVVTPCHWWRWAVARRRVEVELILEASRYLREAKLIALTTATASEAIDDLGDEADGTSADLAELAANTDFAKRQIDDLGDEARGAAFDLRLLEARIEASKLKVRQLGIEFARTGDAVTGSELGRERSMLGQLERIFGDLTEVGTSAGSSFTSGITGALDKVPIAKTALYAGVASVVLEATPLIGALVGGLFSGGVGTTALAAGLLSTARNPRVKAAARTAGSVIADDFFSGSDAFAQPAVDALLSLRRTVVGLDIGGSLAKAAPTVATITYGLERLATNVMPGLNKTLDRMGPFADVAAEGFADLGDTIGDFMDTVSESPGAVEGLNMAFKLLNGTIRIIGEGINWLEDRFHDWLRFNDKALIAAEALARATGNRGLAEAIRQARYEFAEIMDGAPRVGQSIRGIGDAAGYFAGEASRAATAGQNLANAWGQLHGKKLNADEAMLAAIEAAERVKEVFASGGKGIGGDSKVSVENRVALEQAARLAVEAAAKYVELTGDIAGAEKKLKDLQAQTEKNTGATGGQKAAVHELASELFKLPAQVTSTALIIQRTFYQEYRAGERSATGRASGGDLQPGVPYKFGEHGVEYGMFNAPGRMYSHSQSASLAQAWRPAATGGGTVNHTFTIVVKDTSGRQLRKELIDDALGRNQPSRVVAAAYP